MSLIVIEGLDGSGKSSQVNNLKAYLQNESIPFKYIHFPQLSKGIFGELIAKFLRGELGALEEVNPYLVALLYAEDRRGMKAQIELWLQEGYLVLLDRYVCSNIAFQGAKVDDVEALIDWIFKLEYEEFGLPKPDIEVLLDAPQNFVQHNLEKNRQGDDRAYLQGKEDIHESSMEFQARVHQVYQKLFEKEKQLVGLNCTNAQGEMEEKEVVFERLLEVLKPYIHKS